MKCPLWMMGGIGSVNRYNEALGDCLKEECAWWDGEGKMCIVLSIGYLMCLACNEREVQCETPAR